MIQIAYDAVDVPQLLQDFSFIVNDDRELLNWLINKDEAAILRNGQAVFLRAAGDPFVHSFRNTKVDPLFFCSELFLFSSHSGSF